MTEVERGRSGMFEHDVGAPVPARPERATTIRRRPSRAGQARSAGAVARADGPRRGGMLGGSVGSRIVLNEAPPPVARRSPAGASRIQRRVVTRKGGDPLPETELDRIRLAVERGPDAERRTLRLVHLIDDTAEWTADEVLGQLELVPGALPSAGDTAAALGKRPGFEISKSGRYHKDPWTMSFVRDQTTLDDYEAGKPAALVEDLKLQVPVIIRGFRSEDEKPVVARDRAVAVHKALVRAGYMSKATVDPRSQGTTGNFDYREMRRVEVRCPDDIPPEKLDDGRVLGSDPRYEKYGMTQSLADARKLIVGAIGKLKSISMATPTTDSTMAIFRTFFSAADPAKIVANLELTLAQLEHYRPEAPADASAPEGGHACMDESRPGLFYLNEGKGSEARLIAGVLSLTATPKAKAYNVVHEATHGAPALATVDYAYEWQRLFHFLTPDRQVANADSYAMLVGTLEGLSKAPPGLSEEERDKFDMPPSPNTFAAAHGLPPEMHDSLAATWAWLEYYTTQVYVNLRDLYPRVAAGAQLPPDSYLGKLHAITCEVFGLGPGEFPAIAGIIDRVDDVRDWATKQKPFYVAPPPAKLPPLPEGRFGIMVPGWLKSDDRSVMQWQLQVMAEEAASIAPGLRSMYCELFNRVVRMSGWGGPLG